MSLRAELWFAAIPVLLPAVSGAEPSPGRPASLPWVPITTLVVLAILLLAGAWAAGPVVGRVLGRSQRTGRWVIGGVAVGVYLVLAPIVWAVIHILLLGRTM